MKWDTECLDDAQHHTGKRGRGGEDERGASWCGLGVM